MRKRASLQAGKKKSTTEGGGAIVSISVYTAIVVCWAVEYSVMVVGEFIIVVSPWSPMLMVEVNVVNAMEMNVVVEGTTTVNSPEGEPDAIFLVAVRINVDVMVVTATHTGGAKTVV